MKIKKIMIPLSLLLCLGMMNISNNTFAESGETSTKGLVGVKPNNNPDIAVDPDNEKDIDNDKNPTDGPYSIAYVSDFNFGKHAVPDTTATFFALNDELILKESKTTKEVPNFIQVSDSSASKNGWKLFVSSSEELVNSAGVKIEGVTYGFNNVTVNPIETDQNESQKSGNLIIPKAPIKVEVGSKQQVLIAEADGMKGQGRWHVNFGSNLAEGKQSVSMTVPKGAVTKGGIYKSSLIWNFANAK